MEKALCKQNVLSYKKGEWYEYTKRSLTSFGDHVSVDSEENGRAYYFRLFKSNNWRSGEDPYFYDYFYTNQELRKHKLEKINESIF